jgi:DNA-binding NarL/FixJ family response regulator
MRALPAPADNVETLAEILGEDLAEWPEHAWLVLDDYHEVAQEPRAEDFVAALLAQSPVQFLIASRVRPAWVSTKDLLYGETLELTQTVLAMDDREAAELLVDRSARSASGLVSLANGWPAVIGLASVSSADFDAAADAVPESLYRYFADEVFGALGAEVQQGLTTLSVAPVLDRELVVELLGTDEADDIASRALDVGILVERSTQIDLHPLARAFLAERAGQLGLVPAEGSGETCLAHYRDRRDWDAAFELIVRSGWTGELASLLEAALDDLLESARLSTLERWCDFASDGELDAPILAVTRAEVLLRQGRHLEAIARAGEAASRPSDYEYRTLGLAGRAAHLASREEEALDFYRRAGKVAHDEFERRDARWGELGCLIDLEDEGASDALEQLSHGVSIQQPRELIRSAAYRLYLQMRSGSIDLEEADTAYSVLSAVDDPLVASSFLSAYAGTLALQARYREAKAISKELGDLVERFRYDFALPYVWYTAATAHSGLREWSEAEGRCREAIELAVASRDGFVEQIASSLLLRIYAQQGRLGAAFDLGIAEPRGGLKASRAELACSVALVLACANRFEEALGMSSNAKTLTNAVEPSLLTVAVEAICALRAGGREAIDRVDVLASAAFDRGALDLLVSSYRACPELLPILVRGGHGRDVEALIQRVGDADLAEVAGHPIVDDEDRHLLLSPREREVYELICGGLTNKQIAQALYIEESTARAHTHHVFDKLGVRSRKALAIQAVLRRSQATATTGESSEPE